PQLDDGKHLNQFACVPSPICRTQTLVLASQHARRKAVTVPGLEAGPKYRACRTFAIPKMEIVQAVNEDREVGHKSAAQQILEVGYLLGGEMRAGSKIVDIDTVVAGLFSKRCL